MNGKAFNTKYGVIGNQSNHQSIKQHRAHTKVQGTMGNLSCIDREGFTYKILIKVYHIIRWINILHDQIVMQKHQ